MKIKTRNNILVVFAAVLMVFAMMLMMGGTVFAEADKDLTRPTIDLSSIQAIRPEGNRATVGDTVTLSVDVSDDRGVRSISITYVCVEQEGQKTINLTYTGEDPDKKSGTWQGDFTVGEQTENGLWIIREINAYDTSSNRTTYYNYNWRANYLPNEDLSAFDFEVYTPELPLDFTAEGYSIMLDGADATTAFGGNYYVNSQNRTVTPVVKVRFDDEKGWTTVASRKFTLKYEKKTGEDSWEEYTDTTFTAGENDSATYRVSAAGNESLGYVGTIAPVEFIVTWKCTVAFNTRGGSIVDPCFVLPGENAAEPENPTKNGLFFGNWYSDAGLTNEYDFSSAVTGDITLYASWYANMSIGVYNDTNPENDQCGTVDIESASVNGCYQDVGVMNFTEPEGTVKFTAKPAEGYSFIGWYQGVIGDSSFVENYSDPLLSVKYEYTCDARETAICAVFGCAGHNWEQKVQKATPDADGRIYQKCTVCGVEETVVPLLQVSNISLEGEIFRYTGKAIEPKVTVANASEELSAENYAVEYSNNVNPGTATAKVTLKGDWYEGTKELTFTITEIKPTIVPTIEKGKVYNSGGQEYIVTEVATESTQGEVVFKTSNNTNKVTVPPTVKLADSKVYEVTQINDKAFTGKSIRTVTIGKNVKTIKKNAFNGSKATKIIVKTQKLTKKTVKGSLKGSKIRTVQVKVGKKALNRKYVKKYKKIFTKKITGKKVTVK